MRSRKMAALIGAATIAALGAAGGVTGSAGAASSSPFACDQPDWAGGAAMRLTIERNKAASIPVPRPCFPAGASISARVAWADGEVDSWASTTARFVRFKPRDDRERTVAVDFSAAGVSGRQRVLVDVRGWFPGPNAIAIGDSVTAAFGYCGIRDVCTSLHTPVANSWMALKDCNQEAEYPKLPDNACSNNRGDGLPWTNVGQDNAGVSYPGQFDWWLFRASRAAGFPNPPRVRNWAVSGARPAHWDPTPIANDPTNKNSTPGGFSGQTKKIENSFVTMTLGANKLLADFLSFDFAWPISWFADTTGDYAKCTGARGWFWGYEEAGKARLKRCFEEDWAVNKQAEHLTSVYRTLLSQGNRVLVVGYHLACPSTFGTWQQMSFSDGPAGDSDSACTAHKGDNGMSQFDQAIYVSGLLNDAIRDAVESTRSWARAQWPRERRDSRIAFVDTAAIDDWTKHQTWDREKWVFPNDTGIHPSIAGHAVMAKNVAEESCALLGLYCVQHAALDPQEFKFPGKGARVASAFGAGAAVVFVGVGLLASHVVRPLSLVVGKPLEKAFGVSGRLARENSAREPRRTASTASALMIGVTLVAFVAIFAAGLKASIDEAVNNGLKGDLVVQSETFQPVPTSASRALAQVPGVGVVSPVRFGVGEVLDGGGKVQISGVDPATVSDVFTVGWKEGSDALLKELGGGRAVVSKGYADKHDLKVGSGFTVLTPTGERVPIEVAGIYDDDSGLLADMTLANATLAQSFNQTRDAFVVATTRDGENADAVQKLADRTIAASYPTVEVLTKQGFVDDQANQIDQLITLVYVLLSLSVIVSLFGIVNTLVLSIHERTRELGMLRAIGTSRRQVRQIVRYESVITALIGAVLGVILGVIFAILVTIPLKEEGFALSIPVGTLIVLLVLAAIAGVAAAILPARRAAKLDVLRALAYE